MERSRKVPAGKAHNWVYKCTLCPRTFRTCQGLAGHMNGHRFDDGYQRGSSHLRLPYDPAAESPRFTAVDFWLPPPVSRFPLNFRPPSSNRHSSGQEAVPMGATRVNHGGWGHAPLAVPPPGSQSSSERTVTDPNLIPGFSAKGSCDEDEEEVIYNSWVEVDTELKLSRG